MLLDSHQLAAYIIGSHSKPLRLRLAGFPSCGKTTISKIICQEIPNTFIIESESWLYPLQYRITKDLSGAHPESYDLMKCCSDLTDLLAGQEVKLRRYEHEAGDHVNDCSFRLNAEAGLILDGTPFFLEMFNKFTASCMILYPKNYDKWLELSVQRDISTRFFSHAEATRHNMRKARDIEKLLRESDNCSVIYCMHHENNFLYEVLE